MYKSIVIVILIFGLFLFSFAGERESLKTILKLTPQQEEEFIKLKKIGFSRDSVCFTNLEKLRAKLLHESSQEEPDSVKINEISLEIGKVHAELSVYMADNINAVRKILTPAQFEKFMEHNNDKIRRGSPQKQFMQKK